MAVPSTYRTMLEQLSSTPGHTPHWPVILRQLLTAEYRRQQADLSPYTSVVAIRRQDSSWEHLDKAEDRDVRRLYKTCEDSTQSVLTIGDNSFLLLGWQWPNQASENGRRADLVGMNQAGGLVVFEAKGPTNSYSPLMATLEGLDYLVHLTLDKNFSQIIADFEARIREASASRPFPPAPFKDTEPNVSACHDVIVLAPAEYFRMHGRSGETSGRGHGWKEFSGSASDGPLELRFRCAETDFTATSAQWV